MIGQSHRLIWAGGEHDFRLDIGHLRALEQRLDAGAGVILKRLMRGDWKVDDIIETLRIGLQGAGMEEREALKVIDRAFPTANLYELSVVAAHVLAQFISWRTGKDEDAPEDEPGETKAATTPSPEGEHAGLNTSAPLQ